MGKIVNNKWASIFAAAIVSVFILLSALPGASQSSEQPTASAQVVVPAFVDISIIGSGAITIFDFGTINPGVSRVEMGSTAGTPYRIELNNTANSNVGINFTTNLTANYVSGGNSIAAANHVYNNRHGFDNSTDVAMLTTSLPTGPCVAFCGGNFSNWTNVDFSRAGSAANNSRFMSSFLTVPAGTAAATYTATVTISAHRNNTS